MLDLKNYKGFCIQSFDNSRESLKLYETCLKQDIKIKVVKKGSICPKEYIPCGSVKFCEVSLGKRIIPNYYPEWCSIIFNRKIWFQDKWIIGKKLFVKPSDRYKRFTGFVTTGYYKNKKKGKLVWSEIVHFENEWRYYISNGKIMCSGWYWGKDEDKESPDISFINIPNSYSGALDIGIANNKITLVESQHPFACGHYSDEHENYFQWLINGWEYMNKENK